MPEIDADKTHRMARLARRIAVGRVLTRALLLTESVLPLLMPVLAVVCLFLAAAWFGLFRIVPDWVRVGIVAGFAVALVWSVLRLHRLRWPDVAHADQHLERVNHLPHQAIAVLDDHLAVKTPVADALWQAHRKRMAARITSLHVGFPGPDIARHDPYALRSVPVLLVLIAFAFSYSGKAGSLSDAFVAQKTIDTNPSLRIDAWVTPPAYTGKPPIYLTGQNSQDGQSVDVPQFSRLTVRISGGSGSDAVVFSPKGANQTVMLKAEAQSATEVNTAGKPASLTHLMDLSSDGTLRVNGQSWSFVVTPDVPPQIAFEGEPHGTANGSLEIGFKGSDDFGIQSAKAEIVPVDTNGQEFSLFPLPEFRLDLSHRAGLDVKGVTSRNISEHPLSGKLVQITLVATDGAGQTGKSRTKMMILPSKPFQEPLAAAVAEQRQVFSLDVRQIPRAMELSKALMIRPDETIPNLTQFLMLQSTQSRLALSRDEAKLKDTARYFWEVALALEDGDVSLAEKNLRDAQENLADALQRNASDAEIQKLMAELRKAMDAYMQAMAKQMQNDPNAKNPSASAQNVLREDDLKKMLDQIENLARSGSREEASKMLSDLQRMMNNLQTGKRQKPGEQKDDRANKQMEALGKLLQDQQKLMDQTYGLQRALEDRMQMGDPEEGEDGALIDPDALQPDQQGEDPKMSEEQQKLQQMTREQLEKALKDLKTRQEGLKKDLDGLMDGLKELGAKPGKGFGDAGKEMDGASGALGNAQGGAAVEGQGKALQALREGAKDLMKQNGQGQGQGQAGNMPGDRDPLGRSRQQTGSASSDEVKVPDEIDIQKAREILETIRKKLGTSLSPEQERQYLERLLDMR
jgi:uncharacterized protein (TIGR02302 family)